MKKTFPRPTVIANFAITADGKVSTRNYTPTGFTSASDKRRLQEIRARGDALLAGASTVKADNMSMGISATDLQKERSARGQPGEPLRVMVSNSGALDLKAKVFAKTSSPLAVFSTKAMPGDIAGKLSQIADLWLFHQTKVDLAEMLGILYRDYKVRTLVCEGGPSLFRALLEIAAVDELHLTWAPLIFGGKQAPTLTGLPDNFLPATLQGQLTHFEPLNGECFLSYKIKRRLG
ncbi:2,5-diamino-6-(ribosylamino)-4(3H)-pyrimidinone 5'-phosphate reductase [soil metagenome]